MTPDDADECRGRLRYPTLAGARTALAALRDTAWGACEPRRCKVCPGWHLAPPKKQAATKGRAA